MPELRDLRVSILDMDREQALSVIRLSQASRFVMSTRKVASIASKTRKVVDKSLSKLSKSDLLVILSMLEENSETEEE
ncbi:hypothetical protein KKH13_04720 [Patescibacteria group bacterium]|uniref:Uncharacterized protein n=1 Tax=viral metagenome TaxID=1070528 RepID=A0A6M3KPU1_9ZZZZ|nr:hypothetical protein [Patescibacteria group bacterium]